MADDFAVATAAPRSVTIAGGTYLIGKFGPRDLGDLQAYLKESIPDPRLMARDLIRDMPDGIAKHIWDDLFEQARTWPPEVGSPDAMSILFMTHEGAARVIWVLLRRHNAGVDLERARKLAEDIGFAELQTIFNMGFPEPSFDPKAPGTPTTTVDRGPVPA